MLGAFQDIYVRLCADEALREHFLRAPDEVLSGYALCEREQGALRALDRGALVRFAESLLSKRCDELIPHVRQTLRICPEITRRYRRWLARNPARVAAPHAAPLPPGLSEALRALDDLCEGLHGDESQAPYAAGVLRFEVWEQASRLDAQPRQLRSRWRLDALIDDLRRGIIPVDPDEGRWMFQFTQEGALWRSA